MHILRGVFMSTETMILEKETKEKIQVLAQAEKLLESGEKKKLKIAIFVDAFFPMIDGVVMVVDNYARILSREHEICVFCPKPNRKDYVDEFAYKVVRSKKIKIFFLDYDLAMPKFDKKFKKQIEEFAPDICHIHSPFSIGKMGVKYAKKAGVPLVATLHSQFKQDFYRATKIKWLTNSLLASVMKVFNACDECWTVNTGMKELYEQEYGLKVPCYIVPNATEVELTDYATAEKRMQEMFGIQPGENMMLFVGRINALKNIYLIVDSLKIAKDKGLKFKMLYIGGGQDIETLRKKVKENDLGNEIIVAGRVENRDDIVLAYRRANLFLFPSWYDTNSLVQIEAASQKTATLFIRGTKTSSTVEENVSGFKCDDGAEAYAEKICEIFENKEELERISEGAHKNLYKTWEEVVQMVEQNYYNLLEKKNTNK